MRALLLAAVVIVPLLGQQPKDTTYFAIHLVSDCGPAEKSVVKDKTDGKQYCIESLPVITDRDISSATSTSVSRPALVVTLGAEGSERLYKATAPRVGKGSLVLRVNGEVVGVSKIYEPLRDFVTTLRLKSAR